MQSTAVATDTRKKSQQPPLPVEKGADHLEDPLTDRGLSDPLAGAETLAALAAPQVEASNDGWSHSKSKSGVDITGDVKKKTDTVAESVDDEGPVTGEHKVKVKTLDKANLGGKVTEDHEWEKHEEVDGKKVVSKVGVAAGAEGEGTLQDGAVKGSGKGDLALSGSQQTTEEVDGATVKTTDSGKVYGSAARKDGKNSGKIGAQLGKKVERRTTTEQDGAKVATTEKAGAKVYTEGARKKGKNSGKVGAQVSGSVKQKTTTTDEDGAKVATTEKVGAKLSGEAARRSGKTRTKGAAELSGGVARTKTTQEEEGKVARTAEVGGKVYGKAAHKNGETSGTVGAELSGGLEKKTSAVEEDGTKVSRTNRVGAKVYGEAARKDAKTDGKAGAELTGGVEKKTDSVAADGAKVTRTDSAAAKVYGEADRKDGKTARKAGVELTGGVEKKTDSVAADGAKVTRTDKLGAKVYGEADRKEGETQGKAGAELSGGVEEKTSTVAADGAKVTRTDKVGAKVYGEADRKEGKTGGKVGAEVSGGRTEKTTSVEDGADVTRTQKTAAKVYGEGARKDGKNSSKVGVEVKGGYDKETKHKAGDRDVTDTLSVGTTTGVEGGSEGLKGKQQLDLGSKKKESWSEDGKDLTRTTSHGAKVHGEADRKDGKTTLGKGVGLSTGVEQTEHSQQGNTTFDKKWSAKGELDASTKGDERKGGAAVTLGRGTKEVTTDGDTRTTHAVDDKLKLSGDVISDKDETGARKSKGSVGLEAGRTVSDEVVKKDGDDTVTDTSKRSDTGTAGYKQGDGFSVGLTHATDDKTVRKTADGKTISSGSEKKTSLTASKKGVGVDHSVHATHKKTEEKFGKDGKLTTTVGDAKASAGAHVGKNDKGETVASAEAKADATAFGQKVEFNIPGPAAGLLGLKSGDRGEKVAKLQTALRDEGQKPGPVDGIFGKLTTAALKEYQGVSKLKATGEVDQPTVAAFAQGKWFASGAKVSAEYKVGHVEAGAKGEATFGKDKIVVKGNANAKASLVEGAAKISTPAISWQMLGEDVDVELWASVSAGILAEAKGEIEVNIDRGSDHVGADIKGGGGGSVFAGARAGAEIGAKLHWKRKGDYAKLLKAFAKSLPGSWDDALVDKVPDNAWPQIAAIVIGSGSTDLIAASAGVEGSAGIGAEATAHLGLSGGKINVSGSMKATVGLGVGSKTNIMLDAVDGVRFAGVMAMRGQQWLASKLSQMSKFYSKIKDQVGKRVDAYMEAKKKQGGFSGWMASGADWLMDDVMDLY